MAEDEGVEEAKDGWRARVWEEMRRARVARFPGAKGRALGIETGWIDGDTTIVTTVHPLQVVDDELPETDHDFRVDLVVTPDEILPCPSARRPPGILWDHLDQDKIDAVPALARRRESRGRSPAG